MSAATKTKGNGTGIGKALPTLEASGFVVKDADGTIRAKLCIGPAGDAILALFDGDGNSWVEIEVPPYGGARIDLWSSKRDQSSPVMSLALDINGAATIDAPPAALIELARRALTQRWAVLGDDQQPQANG